MTSVPINARRRTPGPEGTQRGKAQAGEGKAVPTSPGARGVTPEEMMRLKYVGGIVAAMFVSLAFVRGDDVWDELQTAAMKGAEPSLRAGDLTVPKIYIRTLTITTPRGKVQTEDLRAALRDFLIQGRIPASQMARGFFDQRRFVRYVCVVRLEDLVKAHPECADRATVPYVWWLDPIVSEEHFKNAVACRELLMKLDPSWKNEPPPPLPSGSYGEPESASRPSGNGFGAGAVKVPDGR